jgi:hypothetical protein
MHKNKNDAQNLKHYTIYIYVNGKMPRMEKQ